MLTATMLEDWRHAPGFDEAAFSEVHESGAQVVSIRMNPAKWKDSSGLSFPLGEKVPWNSYGFYLEQRPFFTFEPWLHAGVFYVQEASSMFLETAIRQTVDLSVPVMALDGCAAPGGKSTLIQSLLPPKSVLVSNEVIRNRATILEENLIKWGSPNSIVTSSDPREFAPLGPVFDLLVVDAPCSGSGLFRRDPDAAEGWSRDLVKLCSQRQQRILADYWQALKPGGILIYSTCSYSVEEDEAIADWIMESWDAVSLPLDIPEHWNIVTSQSSRFHAWGYRFYPDRLMGEGLFLAAFRKEDGEGKPPRPGKPKWEPIPARKQQGLKRWIADDWQTNFVTLNQSVIAWHSELEEMLMRLGNVYVRQAGLLMGKLAGEELIPETALALNQQRATSLPQLSFDWEQALRYLRKEEIPWSGSEKGWYLATFAGQSLGWLKLLGNRTNNYYPKEWRILKSS
ncbi:methyltransferase RsmF C-terminal domain-like protein [Flavihumibacter petaseus]|uniref:Putative RNA methyltransferase n=1 Tax=Flavihumibacter petaseus NBRC 106054 TaxID=1220578 RepID=A0A0E9MZZ2_9BACT|nr:hypothetical protein [Flavihumibacter petaseus]GAO42946.1 putative RNA methyltransferase [Flavihumibacter petaseus NBRC 106054]